MEPLIKVTNVRKIYRMGDERVVALDNISLEIYRGEVVCFLGTSGSGKSTFLNMVAGLEKPTRGELYFSGVSFDADADSARECQYAADFQEC